MKTQKLLGIILVFKAVMFCTCSTEFLIGHAQRYLTAAIPQDFAR